ncbi:MULTISPECIES: tetratricopeptide repeat protein [Flavobacteriaceae]|uniref:tetratricopeptide repeat protein n=1 Tax=Flavobacteriaceae TaxID=49546 RepID=UPI001491E7C2|nr:MULTISPECIES: tetratricopeptide repeat protein [Allomuricauda]MDC6364744.1 tetratricopeptide repeat protein [Muricauda sp. AC10]
MKSQFCFYTLLFICFPIISIAQYDASPKQIDSLENLLQISPRDTTHTSILTNLWRAHIHNDIDKSFIYADELIKLGKDFDHIPAEYTGYQRMGIAYSYIDDYEKSNAYYRKGIKLGLEKNEYSCVAAMHYNIAANFNMVNQEDSTIYHAEQAIPAFLKMNDSIGSAGCKSLIASVYFKKGQYRLSLENSIEAMHTYQNYDHYRARQGEVIAMNKIAQNYLKMGDTTLALEHLTKELNLHQTRNDKRGAMLNLFQIGLIYSNDMNKLVEAKDMLHKSKMLANELKNPSGLLNANYGLGLYHEKTNEYALAKQYLNESLRLSDSLGQIANKISTNLALARIAGKSNQPTVALELAQEAKSMADSIGHLEDQAEAHKIIYQYNQHVGNFSEALNNHIQFKVINDSIYNLKSNQRMSELQTIYETEKKEAALALKDEEINTLNEKAKVDKLTKGLYAGGMASALALFGLSVFGYRQRIKKNRIAREKQEEIYKQEIAHKKKELASQTLHLVQKNTFLEELKENLENLKNSPDKFKMEFRRIVMLLKKEKASDKDWETFKTYFSEVHNDFDQKLKTLYADISEKEIRLAAFLRMNLTTKEIAATMNVLPDSILKSKYRLKKKLGLDKDTDLGSFLNTL